MSVPSVLRECCEFAKAVIRDYREGSGSLIAASISFYAFLSLIPLLLLCISVAAFFLGSLQEAQQSVLKLVNQFYPAASSAAGQPVRAIVKEIMDGRAAATWLSSIVLLWSGLSLMNSLSKAINVAWDARRQRGFLAQKSVDAVLFLATMVILGVSVGLTAFVEIAKGSQLLIAVLGQWTFSLAFAVLGYLLPLIVTTFAFLVLYEVAPNTKVSIRAALFGAVFSGVLWELAKIGFGFYIAHWATRAGIYGSLGGMVALLMWINYSSIVTILGAKVASEWQRRSAGGVGE